jgi:hypothetical protein
VAEAAAQLVAAAPGGTPTAAPAPRAAPAAADVPVAAAQGQAVDKEDVALPPPRRQ